MCTLPCRQSEEITALKAAASCTCLAERRLRDQHCAPVIVWDEYSNMLLKYLMYVAKVFKDLHFILFIYILFYCGICKPEAFKVFLQSYPWSVSWTAMCCLDLPRVDLYIIAHVLTCSRCISGRNEHRRMGIKISLCFPVLLSSLSWGNWW